MSAAARTRASASSRAWGSLLRSGGETHRASPPWPQAQHLERLDPGARGHVRVDADAPSHAVGGLSQLLLPLAPLGDTWRVHHRPASSGAQRASRAVACVTGARTVHRRRALLLAMATAAPPRRASRAGGVPQRPAAPPWWLHTHQPTSRLAPLAATERVKRDGAPPRE